MNMLIVDTNILISALIKEGLIRKILTNIDISFIFPENGLNEIYKYKEEIKEKANITEKEFDILLLRLMKQIKLIPLQLIMPFKNRAENIMINIHKEDSIFIATALRFNCPIWSDDKHFKKQAEVQTYNTKEIIQLLK
ncbi:MAG: PIN domain-containing protein [Nanoarchaeota archaeon]